MHTNLQVQIFALLQSESILNMLSFSLFLWTNVAVAVIIIVALLLFYIILFFLYNGDLFQSISSGITSVITATKLLDLHFRQIEYYNPHLIPAIIFLRQVINAVLLYLASNTFTFLQIR